MPGPGKKKRVRPANRWRDRVKEDTELRGPKMKLCKTRNLEVVATTWMIMTMKDL